MEQALSFALLGYSTTMRTSIGAKPYVLVYGTKVVIPAEVEMPSLRIIQEAKLDDVEWRRVRQEQHMFIDKKRMDVVFHGQLYQNKMTNAFNRKVKPRRFTPGQLMSKNIFPYQEQEKGMFTPNWKGPYVVHITLLGEAVIIAEMDGKVSTKPINSDTIMRYYI
ncbi:uncharacterized protein [Nicotiana sylvestris]|uniref:uncharacterized protein n=1 Tax=Nicotiana sylvestris TaxID=4096 RepID=UPI00388CDEA3